MICCSTAGVCGHIGATRLYKIRTYEYSDYKTSFHHPGSPRARKSDQFTVLCSLLRVLVQKAAHRISVILVHVAVCQCYVDRAMDGESPASLPSTRPRVPLVRFKVQRTTAKGYWKGSERAYFRRGVGIHVAALEVGHCSRVLDA